MRYAKSFAGVLLVVSSLIVLSSEGETASTRPAGTQPAAKTLVSLTKAITQRVDPVAWGNIYKERRLTSEPSIPNAIVLMPPKEYAEWFRQKSNCAALDLFDIQVLPEKDKMLLPQGPWKVIKSVEDHAQGRLLDEGWQIDVDVNENKGTGSSTGGSLTGTLVIDVRPDHQYRFPFDAKITVDTTNGRQDAKSAEIVWQRPECWKRDE